MKMNFIPYDRFKLIVLLLLLVLLAIMVYTRNPEKPSDQTSSESTLSKEVRELSAAVNANKELPAIPIAYRDLFVNVEKTGLVDHLGDLIYELGEDDTRWVPVIHPEVLNKLPDEYLLVQDESDIWQLTNLSGEVLFIFDCDGLTWKATETREPLVQEMPKSEGGMITCYSATPTRIETVGQMMRVVNAEIPLRSTPDAIPENFIISLGQGTVLQVVGEPVCKPYLNGANLWWPVRTQNGLKGYAAEGSAIGDLYYLEPVD